MKHFYFYTLTVIFFITAGTSHVNAQDTSSVVDKVIYFPNKFFKRVDDRSETINNRILKQSNKYLARMMKRELKMKRKLAKKDSAAAEQIFSDVEKRYQSFDQKISKSPTTSGKYSKRYIPELDSLQTSFKFAKLQNQGDAGKITESLSKIEVLQGNFDLAEQVKKFISARKNALKDQLDPFGLHKQVNKLKKEVYYYQAQIEEYRNVLRNPDAIQKRVLQQIQNQKEFAGFFSQHSQFASLFNLPTAGSSPGEAINLPPGIQTRAQLSQDIQQRFGGQSNYQQALQQNVQGAQAQVRNLKNKLLKNETSNSDAEMPDFKPNTEKTKSFSQRLEFGFNLQSQKSNFYFPTTTDIGISCGYKLNPKQIIGIGTSYKMGWGKSIKQIVLSHQGIGFRTFMDYKLKGSLWISGGSELNYRSAFKNFEIFNDRSAWEQNALIGLSKKFDLKGRMKTNMQLLYDFLHRKHRPQSQPVLFRMGYTLK